MEDELMSFIKERWYKHEHIRKSLIIFDTDVADVAKPCICDDTTCEGYDQMYIELWIREKNLHKLMLYVRTKIQLLFHNMTSSYDISQRCEIYNNL